MNEELKPVRCGCGGEVAVHKQLAGEYEVYCRRCFITTDNYYTEAEAIQAWNTAMGANLEKEQIKGANVPERTAKVENKWHWNCDPYDDSTSPTEAGYYRIIDENGTEMTDYFFGEPRMTGHGIGYWATCEKTILAWSRLEVTDENASRNNQ